jgi:predicted dienelactone hydrolase
MKTTLPIDDELPARAKALPAPERRSPTRSIEGGRRLRLLPLPPSAPQRIAVEHVGDELREKCFHNLVFGSWNALDDPLEASLPALERGADRTGSIVA